MRRRVDRWWLIGLALLIGVVALSAVLFSVQSARRSEQRLARQRNAVNDLRQSVDDVLGREAVLARVLDVVRGPIGRRWPTFANVVLSQPLAFGSGLIVAVPERRRAAYERQTGIRLVESPAPGLLQAASPRPEHFVLAYYEQKSPRGPPLGLDLAANPLRRALLLRAASTDLQVASPPIHFLEPGDHHGVAVYAVVRDRRGHLRGWVTATYEANQLAAMVTAHTPGLRLTVRDGTGALVAGAGRVTGRPQLIEVGGRRWSVWASVTGAGVGAVPWLVLGLGLALALAVVLVLRQAATRERYATRLVARHVNAERERGAELDTERRALADAQAIAQVGSWSWEPAGEHAKWSVQMYRIFGREQSEGPPTHGEFFAYLHPEDRERITSGSDLAFAAGEGSDLSYRIVIDGKVRFLHAISRREREDGYVGTVQDITTLRRAKEALSEAEQDNRTLAMIVAQSEDAIIAKTLPGGVITQWNQGAERVFGYTAAEIVGQPISGLVPPENEGEESEIMRQLLAGRTIPNYETRRVRRDGSVIDVSVTISRIQDDQGRILGASAISRDITEHKRAELKVAEAARFFDLSHDLFCTVDYEGRFVQLNDSWATILGWSPQELVHRSFMDLVHPDDRQATRRIARDLTRDEGCADFVDRYQTRSGAWRWVDWTAVGVPELGLIYANGRDVTARVEAETAQREAEERFRGTFDEAPIGMAIVTLDGRWERVNDALGRILGYSREQLEGMPVASVTHPDDVCANLDTMAKMRSGARSSYSTEKRYLHASGQCLVCTLQATTINGADGRPGSFLSQIQDITERKRNQEQLEYLADHDALTGLMNRRSFARELVAHAGLAARYGPEGTILMIDLDQFKFVNDTLGHQAGDELIIRFGQLLKERLRETDTVARLGGDEFAVLLPKADANAGRTVAASLLEILRSEAISIAGTERKITVSIGIASFADALGLSGEEVLINADLALYDGKEDGRDRYAVFSPDQYTQARMKGRVTWAQRITSALETDNFTLLAQPIVDLATGRTSQFELLLRMRDTHGDLIAPSTFLPIAERLDLIRDIDAWVVTNGIRMLAELQAYPDISLEINLSGRSLGDQKLLGHIDSELRRAGVAAERIIFEITETAALTSVSKARAFGEHLSQIGCRFALDDFGAGFGSFYYLKHLVFDYLKIDGEFIRDCRSDPTDQLVINAIVSIAHGMGKQTIAEFVSDDATVRLLTELGVDYGQGYHLGMPAPLDEQLVLRPLSGATSIASRAALA